jgi:hypothetical protein
MRFLQNLWATNLPPNLTKTRQSVNTNRSQHPWPKNAIHRQFPNSVTACRPISAAAKKTKKFTLKTTSE